jgi:hypothetical protein
MVRVSASHAGGAGSGFGAGAFWGRGDRPPPPSKEHFVAASAPEAFSSQMDVDLIVGGPGRSDGPPNYAYEFKIFCVFTAFVSVLGIAGGVVAEQKYLRDKVLRKALKMQKSGKAPAKGFGVGMDDPNAEEEGRSAGRPIGSDDS